MSSSRDSTATSQDGSIGSQSNNENSVIENPGSTILGRNCWVCFANDEDDKLAPWVQPCNCRGSTKWVHQSCLQRWVDEKQKGNTFKRVQCPQCQIEYIIVLPSMGTLATVLEAVDTLIKRVSPFLTAGVIVGSIYWCAVTYGAVTVLQTVGYEEGFALMERTDPVVLLIGLPAIPIGLILGRLIRWEDMVLRFIQDKQRNRRTNLLLSLVLPLPDDNNHPTSSANVADSPAVVQNAISDNISTTRILCGALIMPTISSIVGRLFFDSITNNFQRVLLGGFAFVTVKGAMKIYFQQKQFARKQKRIIVDYTTENIRRFGHKDHQQRTVNERH